ncbi:AMP-binding protein, partial [Candidatus Sumerlaeota bacterium]|nr:AMP-binding protein [Candidatus Sumerlaeota bacterium]
MSNPSTVIQLLEQGKNEAVAIAAPDREPLTYSRLRVHVRRTVERLNELGIGRNDPVAIVLPNGPAMASAFVAVAAGATTAPLNPAYKAEEFKFYLSDLSAALLIVEDGDPTPARQAASGLGIPIVELAQPAGAPAGLFDLTGGPTGGEPKSGGLASRDDIALVLHTSGTTSRPKIVPLSQANVCASAVHVRRSLQLSPDDRCLNVMPLFHIHGLIAAVLGSLGAGASVFCTPGFNALKFFAWMKQADPTWYTAVPTMHQAILSRAARNREIIAGGRLRFIRSSSASLPPRVMKELEAVFG